VPIIVMPDHCLTAVADIMDAMGYSKVHRSMIRAGTWTPLVSTWPALARLVGPGGSLAARPDEPLR
jgi:hypothetical protein